MLRVKKVMDQSVEDKKLAISLLAPYAILMIQFFLLYYLNIINTQLDPVVRISSKIIVGLFFLSSLPIVLRRNSGIIVLTYCISITILAINILFFNQNIIYLKDISLDYLLISLPCFLYSFSIQDKAIFKNVTDKVGNIIFIIGVVVLIFTFTNNIEIGEYSMSFGYYMLLPAILFLRNFFEKTSIKSSILCILSLIAVLLLGSRGPIICIGIYIVLYQILNFKRLDIKRFLFNVAGFLIFITCLLLIDKILELLDKIGISSRNITLLLQNELYSSNSREIIFAKVIHQLKENPIFGIGIAGDRLQAGTYSHNIILEILSGFGMVLGSFILICLVLIIINSLFVRNSEILNQVLIWFTVGIIPLFISGSYLSHMQFWVFLGLAISLIAKPKNNMDRLLNKIN